MPRWIQYNHDDARRIIDDGCHGDSRVLTSRIEKS